MANEAIIVELLGNEGSGDPIRYTCADGTGIAKGALMVLTTPRTVITHAAHDTPFVGIAAAEKVASDGQTSIPVYTNGIFQLVCKTGGTPCTIGDDVSLSSEVNAVELYDTLDNEKGYNVGKAMEDIAAAATGMVRIHK